jgi:methyltransferase (TIGR00027 family)
MKNWAANLRIIEVDHPNTQQLKRTKITEAGISVPDNVVFADINFENKSLEEGLTRIGILSAEPTFFSWLGVTVYLTEPAIDSTLKCMAKHQKGSEAVITFRQRSSEPSQLVDLVSDAGEPFVSYFTIDDFKSKLLKAGFGNVGFLTPELSAKYFQDGTSALSNPKQVRIASAIV